jgi:hypothetical protein
MRGLINPAIYPLGVPSEKPAAYPDCISMTPKKFAELNNRKDRSNRSTNGWCISPNDD